jgi:RNA polymerase sigma factor (sigma-70 family)
LAKQDIEDALTILTDQQKTCVQRALEGYTVREIAQHMGLSCGNVQTYLTAAMVKLKKYFLEP